MLTYQEFLKSKSIVDRQNGFDNASVNPMLFDFQKAIVDWSVKRGRAAVFADCGLGKTPMQLEWSHNIMERTGNRVIIAAPLAVANQTAREGTKFGIECTYLRNDDHKSRIIVTNYEMLDRFNVNDFTAIVLDESSILKSFDGKFRTYVTSEWGKLPYRLACTATPAPNDLMELGNHSEFVGSMDRSQMLSMFFIHDSGETQKWRLKGHGHDVFWRWMASWACVLRSPADLGFDASRFQLPPITMREHIVESNNALPGWLFPVEAVTLLERRDSRRASMGDRVDVAAEIANKTTEQVICWCDLNPEGDALEVAIPDSVQVSGSNSLDEKELAINGFLDGKIRVLISKPSIFGFGMNLQCCAHQVFTGLSDSYEQFYQAVRRCWRFGQTKPVHVDIVIGLGEGAVLANIKRKEAQSAEMIDNMVKHTKSIVSEEIRFHEVKESSYKPQHNIEIPKFLCNA